MQPHEGFSDTLSERKRPWVALMRCPVFFARCAISSFATTYLV
jgi:hypothetical protein